MREFDDEQIEQMIAAQEAGEFDQEDTGIDFRWEMDDGDEVEAHGAPEPDILRTPEWIYRGWMRERGQPCGDRDYNILWLAAYVRARGPLGEKPFRG
jgi:hypothetical protein